jgi:glycosyltransferase involved in cell wall biosynthesis
MTTAVSTSHVELSVLVPAKDEAENLPEFVEQCIAMFGEVDYECELVVVDDGSTDETPEVLQRLVAQHADLKVVTHRSQRGIADALRSAGDVASGKIFVFYPADLQFDPAEIPTLVDPILQGEADLVTGAKQGQYEKAFVSGIYNRLCRLLFGVNVTDLNAVKAYRREIMDSVPGRPDWHRFMVVMAAADGYRLAERPVTLHQRKAGKSKFGIGRIPVGALDLLSVWFQLKFGRKPMLFFGVSGSILFFFGLITGIASLILRYGYNLGFRPLLNLVMMLVISGIALFGFGFVGELLASNREEMRNLGASIDRLSDELRKNN